MLNYNDLNRIANEFVAMNDAAASSMKGYAAATADVMGLINKINKGNKLIKKQTQELEKLEAKRVANGGRLNAQDEARARYVKASLKETQKLTEEYKIQYELNKKNLNIWNLMSGTINTVGSGLKKVWKEAKKHKDFMFEQLRAVRDTEKSMGLLKGQTASFRQTLFQTSYYTSDILVNAKELAEMQSAYGKTLGTNVILSQSQLETMGAMSQVLGVSHEQVGEIAGAWSAVGGDLNTALASVEDLTKGARKMGLNTTETFNKFEKILKKANLYSFKNGVKGMEAMAKHAQKYKVNMESVSSFADKLFDVEGAIEMSANLQVLGGAWSRIADPMQLMFKARNDMAGLQKDIVSAASGVAKFNEATGEFEISSLELHRMRGAAEMTGMSLEELRDQAIAVAKEGKIQFELGGSVKDKDVMEWITNTAALKNGKMVVQLNGKDVEVSKLRGRQQEIMDMLKDERDMKQIAQDAMTADKKIEALINKAKMAFLPLADSLDGKVGDFVKDFTEWLNTKGPEVFAAMKSLTEGLSTAVNWIKDNPIWAGLIAIVGKTLLSVPAWIANGVSLAKGFNMAANLNGSGGPGGGDIGGKGVWSDIRKAFGKTGARGGRGKYLMRAGKGLLKGGGIASIAGLVGDMGLDYFADEGMMDKGGLGYKLGKIGASAATWGGTGAMAGTIVPGLGNGVGAAIGGIGGAGYEAYNQFFGDASKENPYKKQNDFISRPGMAPIPFNSADTLVGLKKDGGLGKALLNNAGVGSDKKGVGGSIRFENALEIKGSIEVKGNGGSFNIDLNDPLFKREITRMVQEQISTNFTGGVRTSSSVV